jgi:hypothetical protein
MNLWLHTKQSILNITFRLYANLRFNGVLPGAKKGFTAAYMPKHRSTGTQRGLAKCAGTRAWEWNAAEARAIAKAEGL